MAEPTIAAKDVVLSCVFKDVGGNKLTKKFRYAKQDVADLAVKSLMDVIIENGRAFNTAPDEKVSADMAVTSHRSFDVLDE